MKQKHLHVHRGFNSKQVLLIQLKVIPVLFFILDLTEEYEEESESKSSFQWNESQRNYIRMLNEEYRKNAKSRLSMRSRLSDNTPHRSKRSASKHVDNSVTEYRAKRSNNKVDYNRVPKRRKQTCSKHELYVDFDEIGWSGWIISPKGYNAFHCKGECPFPLGQNQRPTNHATVQSIVHALRIGKNVGTPCCVPNKLYSISLLYFDDDENVILKQYDDMVAASCGCH